MFKKIFLLYFNVWLTDPVIDTYFVMSVTIFDAVVEKKYST